MTLHDQGPKETLEEAAAGWVARERSGTLSDQEARDLRAWLDRDPEHQAAFEHVCDVWRTSAALRTDPHIMALRDAAIAAHPTRRRGWAAAGAIAAGLVVAVLGGWSATRGGPAELAGNLLSGEQVFSTGVGQTATVTLPDGSIVTLDTDTRLRSRDTAERRLVEMERGQAFFRVAKDPSRPFMVSVAGRTITAVGTEFNVRLVNNKLEVVLAEGRIKVSGGDPPGKRGRDAVAPVADMTAGSRLLAAGPGDWQIARVDVGEATSWRMGQLVFVRRSLGEVVEELNRYSSKKIVLEDEALAAAQITGGFSAGDVDGFVQAVEGYGLASVAASDARSVVLKAR